MLLARFVLILIEGASDLLLPTVNCHVSGKIWGPGDGEKEKTAPNSSTIPVSRNRIEMTRESLNG